MKLSTIEISNYRSIVNTGKIRFEPLQAFVGENNSGKSNIIKAVSCFINDIADMVKPSDFYIDTSPITIRVEFSDLTKREQEKLKPYLVDDILVLEKRFYLRGADSRRPSIITEYLGYFAVPKYWWLSPAKIIEHEGTENPDWKKIAEQNGIIKDVLKRDGTVDRQSYETGIARIVFDNNNIEYEKPADEMQVLVNHGQLLDSLPEFYLLPTITDFSDEANRKNSIAIYRRLMASLADRIIKQDSRYNEVKNALDTLNTLFNGNRNEKVSGRLTSMDAIEFSLKDLISNLMPTVTDVKLGVDIDNTMEMFSNGVSLKINDGRYTDVTDKGHGLQRSIIFGLLQILIKNRQMDSENILSERNLILGVEEPELYIHPQSQRLVYRVLQSFAEAMPHNPVGQVIYTTHSPAFVDISKYERIALVRKNNPAWGTKVSQCDEGVLGSPEDRKGFQLLNSFGLKHNELFFARHPILVEGEQDEIALIAAARKAHIIQEFPEEAGCSIVVCGSKGQIPKFEKILNAFEIKYSVLLELDGKPNNKGINKEIKRLARQGKVVEMPDKLEDIARPDEEFMNGKGHFRNTYYCKRFFAEPSHINPDVENLAKQLFFV